MKNVLVALMLLLLATNVVLIFKQVRIEREVRAARDENIRMAQELAARPGISAEEFTRAQQRLDRADAVMDAVESRLTNVSMILSRLQSAAQSEPRPPSPGSPRLGTRSLVHSLVPGSVPYPLNTDEAALDAVPLVPSSSHGPDGKLLQRSWGPEQLVGPPNTQAAGDIPTAWAPLSNNGRGEEWLHLNYEKPVDISQINVRETYNPGAISKVAAVLADGREVVVWEGTEPAAEAPVDTGFAVPAGVQAQSVKIYLDRGRVPGWNEIDAVELVGRDGTRQWAASAKASSSYAEPAYNSYSNLRETPTLR